MNVYDFDGTILKGDSERYYFDYFFKKYPKAKKHRIKLWYRNKLQKKNKLSDQEAASYAYSLSFNYIPNIDEYLEEFWDVHEKYIKEWYKIAHLESDIVVSGTPRFILEPIMKRLGIKILIASELDKKTGIVTEPLCLKAQKEIRFQKEFDLKDIDKFYSDRKYDIYLAKHAKEAFLVKDNKIIKWDTTNDK